MCANLPSLIVQEKTHQQEFEHALHENARLESELSQTLAKSASVAADDLKLTIVVLTIRRAYI